MSPSQLLDLSLHYYGPGLWLLLAMVGVEVLNLLSLRKLNAFGLIPREVAGLPGIVIGPLLHNDLRHFAGNFLPLLLLGWLLGWLLPGQFWQVVAVVVAGTGLLVWLLARRRVHMGASGLVYGLVGFLVLHGLLVGNLVAAGCSAGLLLLYSGLLWGVLPTARTSWESHLFGLLVGLGLAWWWPWVSAALVRAGRLLA